VSSRAPLPTGTVTFLFTDIEGSTRLVHALGERFEALLARHHALLRETFAASGGVEVATEGDAFFEVFADAKDAVEAAAAAQRALATEDWGEGLELRVRMGIHTGSGKLVGDNYGGIDVHRAARISSVAHGGQVLLSDTTVSLVGGHLGEELRLMDLGEHRLKDIERPERLHQLCVAELRTEFPPPRTSSGMVHNLPAGLTPIVGRSRELQEVSELLDSSRILTLTGPGGTGKTRLSLAVAENCLPKFPDGVFIVFLAPVDDEMLIPSTIAHALGLREQGMTPVETSLKEYLSGKSLLLVLDNFEQIVSGAGFVSQLIGTSPGLRIIVSSRIALHVAGEQEYGVPPLTIPDRDESTSVEMLSQYDAVDLFIQRASAVKPGFSLTNDNADAVAEICRRLDGLPLALELAAARLRVMTPQEMVRRLDASLSLLTGGARDLPQRQQTLRDAIAWSYDLLDEEHKAFFRSLGVFTDGFTLDAAETVADPTGELGLDALELMIDNSLVRRTDTALGTSRFLMLETIREFALECSTRSGEIDGLRDRHARYFFEFVESKSPLFTVDRDVLDEVELENDNIRAALRWTIESSSTDVGLRLGALMWRLWQARGYLAEGRRLLTEILSMPGAADPTPERARAAMALGSITYWQNDFVETRRRYEEALEIFRGGSDEEGLQEALYNSGFLWLLERDPERARAVFEESRVLAEHRADVKGLGNAAWGLAMSAIQLKEWDVAARWGAECGRHFEELNDVFGQGLARFVSFQIARYTGRYEEARSYMRQYAHDWGRQDTEAMASVELIAEIEFLDGDLEKAVRLAAAGAAFREEYGGGSPDVLVDLSDARQIARRTLDEERVEELWAEGYQLTREEAMALAFDAE
jgi:predicted ATPase/class 3 adenylate cyclase